jgi:hypothetical protein
MVSLPRAVLLVLGAYSLSRAALVGEHAVSASARSYG